MSQKKIIHAAHMHFKLLLIVPANDKSFSEKLNLFSILFPTPRKMWKCSQRKTKLIDALYLIERVKAFSPTHAKNENFEIYEFLTRALFTFWRDFFTCENFSRTLGV
jgi:hypothetical protein